MLCYPLTSPAIGRLDQDDQGIQNAARQSLRSIVLRAHAFKTSIHLMCGWALLLALVISPAAVAVTGTEQLEALHPLPSDTAAEDAERLYSVWSYRLDFTIKQQDPAANAWNDTSFRDLTAAQRADVVGAMTARVRATWRDLAVTHHCCRHPDAKGSDWSKLQLCLQLLQKPDLLKAASQAEAHIHVDSEKCFSPGYEDQVLHLFAVSSGYEMMLHIKGSLWSLEFAARFYTAARLPDASFPF